MFLIITFAIDKYLRMGIRVGVRDCDNPSLLKNSTEIGYSVSRTFFLTL